MTGPVWLAPCRTTAVDEASVLTIRSKGFVVEFTDPRFQKAPERFRGVHYCHFISPWYMEQLLTGNASPGVMIGRLVDDSGQLLAPKTND